MFLRHRSRKIHTCLVTTTTSSWEALLVFEQIAEKLFHAFLIALSLELGADTQTLDFGVVARAFQKHPQVGDSAAVIFADVDDNAWISLLLDGDLAAFFFRADFDARLLDFNAFFVQVRRDFNCCVAIFNGVYGGCQCVLDVFVEVVDFLGRGVFVNYDSHAFVVRVSQHRRSCV